MDVGHGFMWIERRSASQRDFCCLQFPALLQYQANEAFDAIVCMGCDDKFGPKTWEILSFLSVGPFRLYMETNQDHQHSRDGEQTVFMH